MSNRLRLKLLSTCQSFIESFSGSIKKKLILVMVLLTCLPLIVLTAVAIHNAADRLESEITGSNLSKIEWSGAFLDDQMKVLDQILFSLMNDQVVSGFMETAQKPDDPLEFSVQNSLFAKLSAQYVSNLNSFDEIQLFKKDAGKTYSVRNGEERILYGQQSTAPWNALGGRKAAYLTGTDPDHFTMYRSIYRFIDRDLQGGIALQAKWSMFNPIFESLESDDSGTILILDETGNIAHEPFDNDGTEIVNANSVAERIKAGSDGRFFKSDDYYVFYQPFAGGKMTIVKLIPTSVVSESGRNTIWFSIWIVSVLIVVSVVFSIFIANKAAAPILKLVRAITWTEETNSDLYIDHNRKDEIGLLEQKYAQIIKSRYQIHIEKRTAQLKALQAQIDPHFLHNTLQSIGAMAVVKDVPDIYHIIQAISSNLRYTMKLGGDLVELKQEFQHVRNYLIIQKFRFKDKITVEWEEDSAAANCLIPPLSLQPIVENAFEHGFRQLKDNWIIRISTRQELDKLYIEVSDNGTGMSEQTELELKERLSRNIEEIIEMKESMALSNIQARIKTQFGSEYGLEIRSALHGGTLVTLVLPSLSTQGGESHG
ncbi:cache domain-containing sensor histidine kinase [Cohnella lupini]|uniref:Two-component system sensor histidine kinase YesM n=1 Tax=Cohnella lupini TaxID=1294267 RepID=A0A3D9IUV8_9BACL|nr:sensor histidine kinase [Cohnella lupini]RED65522.1 two-component system sensor histidine kinase YesM [Cohnella lupini]